MQNTQSMDFSRLIASNRFTWLLLPIFVSIFNRDISTQRYVIRYTYIRFFYPIHSFVFGRVYAVIVIKLSCLIRSASNAPTRATFSHFIFISSIFISFGRPMLWLFRAVHHGPLTLYPHIVWSFLTEKRREKKIQNPISHDSYWESGISFGSAFIAEVANHRPHLYDTYHNRITSIRAMSRRWCENGHRPRIERKRCKIKRTNTK